MSVISSVAPLAAGATFTSSVQFVQRAVQISGTVFADQNGTLFIDQGGDGVNFDYTFSQAVTAGVGYGFEQDVIAPYWRIRFTNTAASTQTVFRLYADPRDVYGTFLAAALAPSAGGAYAVLFWNSSANTYSYVGRFDGLDGFNACANAAIFTNQSGQYAAFLVSTATVSTESIARSTTHNPGTF